MGLYIFLPQDYQYSRYIYKKGYIFSFLVRVLGFSCFFTAGELFFSLLLFAFGVFLALYVKTKVSKDTWGRELP